jgi:hypothetical protein
MDLLLELFRVLDLYSDDKHCGIVNRTIICSKLYQFRILFKYFSQEIGINLVIGIVRK